MVNFDVFSSIFSLNSDFSVSSTDHFVIGKTLIYN